MTTRNRLNIVALLVLLLSGCGSNSPDFFDALPIQIQFSPAGLRPGQTKEVLIVGSNIDFQKTPFSLTFPQGEVAIIGTIRIEGTFPSVARATLSVNSGATAGGTARAVGTVGGREVIAVFKILAGTGPIPGTPAVIEIPTDIPIFVDQCTTNCNAAIQFRLGNSGGKTLHWTAEWSEPRLKLNGAASPATGDVASDDDVDLSLTFDYANLPPGALDPIIIQFADTTAGANVTAKGVSISLTVRGAVLELSTSELRFGQPYDECQSGPAFGVEKSYPFQIINSGTKDLHWTATVTSTDIGFIYLNPASGTVGPGVSSSVDVVIDICPLTPRAEPYTASVEVSDPNAGNSPQTLPISLTLFN